MRKLSDGDRKVDALPQGSTEHGRDARDGLGIEPGGIIDAVAALGLRTRYVARRLHYMKTAGSTNAVLAALAERNEPAGSVVLADAQTEGRGRAGRYWFSPQGRGIWASVLLRTDMPAEGVAPLSVAAAVSVAQALRGMTGLDVRVKWPNDIAVDGRKLGGILIEAVQTADENVRAAVLGIGLNVNLGPDELPPELSESATSLRIALGRGVSRLETLRVVLESLELCLETFEARGWEGFREAWRALSELRGRRVLVRTAGRDLEGVVTDTAPSGALLLSLDGGAIEEVWHGDVSLRPVD
jgi:BirA family biotin operon repressor/biotin-[acetyl-CoA-carboxylase] ligase